MLVLLAGIVLRIGLLRAGIRGSLLCEEVGLRDGQEKDSQQKSKQTSEDRGGRRLGLGIC